MVQTRKLEFVYDAPWEVCILAYEDKFWHIPNPSIPDVLEVTFDHFKVADEGQTTSFNRSGKIALGIPAWLSKWTGGPEVMDLESETVVDRHARRLTCVGRNVTWRTSILLDETTTWEVHPDDPNKTLLTLEGSLEILINLLGLGGAVERLVIAQYAKMVEQARVQERELVAAFAKRYADHEAIPHSLAERVARGDLDMDQAKKIAAEVTGATADTDDEAGAGGAAAGAGGGAGAGGESGASAASSEGGAAKAKVPPTPPPRRS